MTLMGAPLAHRPCAQAAPLRRPSTEVLATAPSMTSANSRLKPAGRARYQAPPPVTAISPWSRSLAICSDV
jgi:hypothetical protein